MCVSGHFPTQSFSIWKGVRDTSVPSPTYIQENPEPCLSNSCTWKIPYWILCSRLTHAAAWQLLPVQTRRPLLSIWEIRRLFFVDCLYFLELGDSSRQNAHKALSYAGLKALRVHSVRLREYAPVPDTCSSFLNNQVPGGGVHWTASVVLLLMVAFLQLLLCICLSFCDADSLGWFEHLVADNCFLSVQWWLLIRTADSIILLLMIASVVLIVIAILLWWLFSCDCLCSQVLIVCRSLLLGTNNQYVLRAM